MLLARITLVLKQFVSGANSSTTTQFFVNFYCLLFKPHLSCSCFCRSKKKQRPLSGEEQKDKIVEEVEELTEQEQLMIQKFKTFEKSHRDILYVLQNWDRAQSMVAKPPTPDLTTGVGEDDISGNFFL